jgi:uncharacterized membrane protein YfcA
VFVTSWQAYKDRAIAERPLVKKMTIAAYVGMPLGLLVFVTVNDDVLRLLLGIAVLIAVVLLAMRINLHHAGPHLDYGAGFVSGCWPRRCRPTGRHWCSRCRPGSCRPTGSGRRSRPSLR